MKTLAPIFLLILVSACDVYYIEPRYDERDRVTGYYTVREFSSTYNDVVYYTMQITRSGNNQRVYLHNFYGADIRVYAIFEFGQLTIPFQVVNGYEVEGSGNMVGSDIQLSYRVRDRHNNTRADFCNADAQRDF